MTDRLRDALAWWDQHKGFLWQRMSNNDWEMVNSAFDAARSYLRILEADDYLVTDLWHNDRLKSHITRSDLRAVLASMKEQME